MSYIPATDFVALLRSTANGKRVLQMPGLDFVLSAMGRASMFTVWVGQTAPTLNQATTVWLKPTVGASFAQESAVFLFNGATSQFEVATPALWASLFTALAASSYVFQKITASPTNINPLVTLAAVQRAAPATTIVLLPSIVGRSGRSLRVIDWSTGVVGHQIQIVPVGLETIMQRASADGGFSIFSTNQQLAGVTLYPSIDLGGWTIP